MKICKDCNIEKLLNEFRDKPSNKDGKETRCKSCRNIRYNKSTPLRVFQKIYNSQILHSVKRGHPIPNYNLEELKNWVDKQPNALALWKQYVASEYDKCKRPSIDRLDDTKPYTLNNIQLITWEENQNKAVNDKKLGVLNAGHKPVIAYDKNGKFYKKFVSINEALREIKGNAWGITSVANKVSVKDGKGNYYLPKSYKGYIWEWA